MTCVSFNFDVATYLFELHVFLSARCAVAEANPICDSEKNPRQQSTPRQFAFMFLMCCPNQNLRRS
jgi:hypothetical protein